MEQVAFAQSSVCDSSVCVCRVAQGVKNHLFSQGSLWNFHTVLPRASDQLFSGAENKAVFCVSPVPQELCRTVRCVYRVLQIPGTNRVCVYCASGFWWDIPVFSRCRRPASSPARSVRYRVSLCVPSSFGVYKPCNLSLCLRTDPPLSLFNFVAVVVLFQCSRLGI